VAPLSTEAVLLRAHDYGDSSRILRFYTKDYGMLSVIAHGVRAKTGKGTTALASFASGVLCAYVKPYRDLHTMKEFSCRRLRDGLGRDVLRFAGASAGAELILSHTEQGSHPELFEAFEDALDRLESVASDQLSAAVLSGLWTIVDGLGFAPQVDSCVNCSEPLGENVVGCFDLPAGGVRCPSCTDELTGPRIGPKARDQVRELAAGVLPRGLTYDRQHFGLVSDFVTYHVAPKPLKSLHFLGQVLSEYSSARS